MENGQTPDKFVNMVTAVAEVDLRLSDFDPVSSLNAPNRTPSLPKFPAIDYHNHLDSTDPAEVLEVMDACGVERIVNITMQTGDTALATIDRFHATAPDRFSAIGWMDWTGLERADFVALTLDRIERLREHGVVGIKFWKDFGLNLRNSGGDLLRIDDERFAPIFTACGQWGLAVMFHTADPTAFFRPIDRHNERYEELAAHPDWAFSTFGGSKRALLEARNRVIARHPEVTFVGAHCAESGEDLPFLRQTLDRLPNLMIDFSARSPELGRQPYSARRLFLDYQDRIVFGTDLLPDIAMYRAYFRFLETEDEYFDYPSHASRQGRWNIYGLHLPDEVLQKVYRDNALRLLSLRGA